jgi:transcriptional regulator with XRE-family HTH domain
LRPKVALDEKVGEVVILISDSLLAIVPSMSQDAAGLLREARKRAGLSQRELARRAGTAQSVVARIERGLTDPSWETLTRLIAAAGFGLQCELAPRPAPDSHMLEDVARILALTPEERLAEVRNVNNFLAAARGG